MKNNKVHSILFETVALLFRKVVVVAPAVKLTLTATRILNIQAINQPTTLLVLAAKHECEYFCVSFLRGRAPVHAMKFDTTRILLDLV